LAGNKKAGTASISRVERGATQTKRGRILLRKHGKRKPKSETEGGGGGRSRIKQSGKKPLHFSKAERKEMEDNPGGDSSLKLRQLPSDKAFTSTALSKRGVEIVPNRKEKRQDQRRRLSLPGEG